ncbi:hypothetical protein KC351_g14133 [Hortaea werneckii]|nr:hypothetical protein KC351_g14133 [Hortaea werneckii]
MIEDIKQLCDTDENLGRFGLGAFYFTFSDKQKQSYEDLLRSLVEQLAWKQDSYSRLQQAFDNASRGRLGKDELEKILDLSFQAYDRVFITLDALDESPEENDIRQKMLKQLEKLVQNAFNVKLLATSREVRDIQESMGMLKAERINVADSEVDKDIRKYVVSELSKDRRLSRLSDKTTSLIEDTLSARADGMFRWAHCQIQELKKLKSTKPKYIEDVLRTLPKTLDETYDRMLCAIEERYRPEALTLLRWITYSKVPLTLEELAEAAIVDPSGEGTVDIDNRGDIEDSLDILSGLVMVYGADDGHMTDDPSNNTDDSEDLPILTSDAIAPLEDDSNLMVRLAHFSVKEYLESERILESIAKGFYLDAANEHRFLAQSCMTYLMYCSDDMTEVSGWEDQRAHPLLKYSAESWYYHVSLQADGDLRREVQMLTTHRFMSCWLFNDLSFCVDIMLLYFSGPVQAIYFASCAGLGKVAELLLARGANVNAQGGKCGHALQAACDRGNIDLVELLLESGADVNAQGGYYGSALTAASFKGYIDIVELLLRKGAKPNGPGHKTFGNALQAASLEGHVNVVELLMVKGADLHAQGGRYNNALHAASVEGYAEVVELLLRSGANVNAQGGEYGNALQAAAVGGHRKVVSGLLIAGANVNAQGGDYGTALQAAKCEKHEEIVNMLLAAGAVPMEDDQLSNESEE